MTTKENVMDETERTRFLETLRSDPEFRAAVRRELLSDELLALPERFAEFTAFVDGRFAQIDGRFAQIDGRFEQVDGRFDRLEDQLNSVRGDSFEMRVRGNPDRFLLSDLEDLLAGPIELEQLSAFIARLDQREALSSVERRELRAADFVGKATSAQGSGKFTVVVEVSCTLHVDDVERAARRAEIVGSRGFHVQAVAIGNDLGGDVVARRADDLGVRLIAS